MTTSPKLVHAARITGRLASTVPITEAVVAALAVDRLGAGIAAMTAAAATLGALWVWRWRRTRRAEAVWGDVLARRTPSSLN